MKKSEFTDKWTHSFFTIYQMVFYFIATSFQQYRLKKIYDYPTLMELKVLVLLVPNL